MTSQNSVDGFAPSSYSPFASQQQGTLVTPSNVTRLCRALQPRFRSKETDVTTVATDNEAKAGSTSSGDYQIVCYKPGVASARNAWDHFFNGATARSISENIRDAYISVAESWEYGAEIYLLGFSRGSFVARSTAALIASIGILNKEGLESWHCIFEDWEHQNESLWASLKYPGKRLSFNVEMGEQYCEYARQLAAVRNAHDNLVPQADTYFRRD